jgi:uncharacterized protein YbbC (DUF1343 family)
MAVRTGLQALIDEDAARLKGLSVGLVTNQTGRLSDGTAGIEALRAREVRIKALFGPEHGVRGDTPAGDYVPSTRDQKTGLPVHSLYGPTKVPTAAMLAGLDILVFDIQDIGARSYTYLSTLGCVLEGAAVHKIPVLVLDRPNPSGLMRVEGGPPRAGFFSFIGRYPTAYLHGLTLGEAAQLLSGEGLLTGGRKADVSVMACPNLTRRPTPWSAYGLPWVPTSPNVRRPETAVLYAATGILGELSGISIGIGTTQQFALAGAPGIDGDRLAKTLTDRDLTGFSFRSADWTPSQGAFRGRRCSGVAIVVTEFARAELTRPNFELLDALRRIGGPTLGRGGATRLFDLSCGTSALRQAFLAGAGARDLWAIFSEGSERFAGRRPPYLIYP